MAEKKSPKKYFSYFNLIEMSDLGFPPLVLTSNKPTSYLLNYGDFEVIIVRLDFIRFFCGVSFSLLLTLITLKKKRSPKANKSMPTVKFCLIYVLESRKILHFRYICIKIWFVKNWSLAWIEIGFQMFRTNKFLFQFLT